MKTRMMGGGVFKRLSCGKDVLSSQPTEWAIRWLRKEESNHGDETDSLGSWGWVNWRLCIISFDLNIY